MICTLDFFFISCAKSQPVNGGASGVVCPTGPPLSSSSSSAGGIRQLELICERFPLSVCWLRFSRGLLGVTLSRALLRASSSCSHPSPPNTCHCQSQGDNTAMILSFGLIKSLGLFELQSLQQIIAAQRF